MSTSSDLYEIYRSMSMEERLRKCWELTEWSMKINPRWKNEIERRTKESYSLV